MRSHVSRQPAGLAIATYITVLFIAVLRSVSTPYPAEAPVSAGVPLADMLDALIPPGIGRYIFTILLLVINAILLARIMIIYKTTQGRSYLPFVIYTLAATGVFFPVNSLAAPLSSLLLVASSDQAVSAFRRRYRFGAVFKSAFMLGIIPLLYSPAICLIPILAVTLAIYQRTAREVAVAIAAALLPYLLFSVGWWFAGYPFLHLGSAFVSTLTGNSALSVINSVGGNAVPVLIFCGIYVFAALMSIMLLISRYSQYPNRVRNIYVHFTFLILCSAGMMLLPSANPATSIAILAVPASVMVMHSIIRLKAGMALALYILLLAGFFTANLPAIL